MNMEEDKKDQEVKTNTPEDIIKELLDKGVIETEVKNKYPFDDEDYDSFMGQYWA
jgi:hypothetical protein